MNDKIITAKLRCMHSNETWEGLFLLDFYPVKPRRIADRIEEDGSAENERFWKASPSGELDLKHEGAAPFRPNGCVKVHMERVDDVPDGERFWKLSQVAIGDGYIEVSFYLPWSREHAMRDGTMKLRIDNEEAWAPFVEAALSAFIRHQAGSSWRFVFEPAAG